MPTQKNTSPTQTWIKPDWALYRHQRQLVLWQVVALSLNAEPDLAIVRQAKLDAAFNASYEKRKKILGRMLSVEPLEDHVTYFPWHEYNKNKPKSSNRMVDVVSCIEKLQKFDSEELPKEFVALLDELRKVPLPRDPRAGAVLHLSPNINIALSASPEKVTDEVGAPNLAGLKKKDQAKAIETKAADQLSAMLYAVVRDAYNNDLTAGDSLDQTVNEAKLHQAANEVIRALKDCNVADRYGLSPRKIKDALVAGKNWCKSKDI